MIPKINKTKQALWVGIGSLTTFSFTIVITAILARHLTKEDLGTYRQILYVYNTLVIVFTAGLPKVFAYYLPKYDLQEGKSITYKITKILFLCGFSFSIFMFLTSDLLAYLLNNGQLKTGLKYFSIIPVLLLPTLGIEGIFSSYQKTTYIALYNILSKLFILGAITFTVIFYGGTYENAIIGWILSSIINLLFALFLKNVPYKNFLSKTTELALKDVFKYSLPIVFAALSGISLRAADQFYISRFFGPEVFAEFANGFVQLPFVGMITGAASTVLMPIFSKLNKEGNSNDEIRIMWKTSFMKSAYLIYPIVIFFIFFSEPVIRILYTEQYLNSATYFQIAMILNFFNIIIFAPLLLAMGKTKLYAKLHLLFAVTAWVGIYPVYLILNSPYSIAIYSVINNILLIIVCFIVSAKLLGQKILNLIPLKEISKIILLSFVAILLTLALVEKFLIIEKDIAFIIISLASYLIILFIGTILFKLNYLNILRPILH